MEGRHADPPPLTGGRTSGFPGRRRRCSRAPARLVRIDGWGRPCGTRCPRGMAGRRGRAPVAPPTRAPRSGGSPRPSSFVLGQEDAEDREVPDPPALVFADKVTGVFDVAPERLDWSVFPRPPAPGRWTLRPPDPFRRQPVSGDLDDRGREGVLVHSTRRCPLAPAAAGALAARKGPDVERVDLRPTLVVAPAHVQQAVVALGEEPGTLVHQPGSVQVLVLTHEVLHGHVAVEATHALFEGSVHHGRIHSMSPV